MCVYVGHIFFLHFYLRIDQLFTWCADKQPKLCMVIKITKSFMKYSCFVYEKSVSLMPCLLLRTPPARETKSKRTFKLLYSSPCTPLITLTISRYPKYCIQKNSCWLSFTVVIKCYIQSRLS